MGRVKRVAVALLLLALGGCSFTLVHLSREAPRVNPPPPAAPESLQYCDRDHGCHCWVCGRFEDARSLVCAQKYYVPCGKVE